MIVEAQSTTKVSEVFCLMLGTGLAQAIGLTEAQFGAPGWIHSFLWDTGTKDAAGLDWLSTGRHE